MIDYNDLLKLGIDEVLRLARLGAAVEKGGTEIFATTACKGMYESEECNRVKDQCVLKYYCKPGGTE